MKPCFGMGSQYKFCFLNPFLCLLYCTYTSLLQRKRTDIAKHSSTDKLCNALKNRETEFGKYETGFAIVVLHLHVYAKLISITTQVLTASSVTSWILSASKSSHCSCSSDFDLGGKFYKIVCMEFKLTTLYLNP
jgi:hypothetical protein